MSKLDDLLELAGFQIFPYEANENSLKAKKQFKSLMLDIIGKDDYINYLMRQEYHGVGADIRRAETRNKLRGGQRKAVEAL